MKRKKIVFYADVPDGVSIQDLEDFVIEWMTCGGGCRHPNDPLFGSLEDVVVTEIKPGRGHHGNP